ncbi:hypothetical protein E2542_SST28671 [Spatholobus suberectus]|nr:hypothetical protein E2542_SST28671 [Spatholobus suberectus]
MACFHACNAMNALLKRSQFLADEGIDAVREKPMLDLKTEADRMKDAILRKEVAEENDVAMEDAPPPLPEEDVPLPITGAGTWNLGEEGEIGI